MPKLVAIFAALLLLGCPSKLGSANQNPQLLVTEHGEHVRAGLPSLPLGVWSVPEHLEGTLRAVRWWNEQLGCEFLRVVPTPAGADIAIFSGEPSEDKKHVLGFTTFPIVPPDSRHLFRYRVVPTIQIIEARKGIIEHEIGHALGLDHDKGSRHGVMRPAFGHSGIILLEPEDLDWLAETYGLHSYRKQKSGTLRTF